MPPPYDPMVNFLLNDLPTLAADKLNAMALFPGANPGLMKVWDKNHPNDTTWWYEGTIRAVVFAQISKWADAKGKGEYLVLAEQPYPPPFKTRVDVAVVTRGGSWILIEIKADFDIATVPKDAQKLQDAYGEMGHRYMWGFAFYSLYKDAKAQARWQKEFARYLDDFGSSEPILRQ